MAARPAPQPLALSQPLAGACEAHSSGDPSPKAPDFFAACVACQIPPCTSPWSTLPDMVQHRRVSLLPMRPTTAPPPPPLHPHPPLDVPCSPSLTSEESLTLTEMQRGELRPPTPRAPLPAPRISNRWRPYPRRGFPPPSSTPQQGDRPAVHARTSGAPRFVVCSCTMSDAGPDGSASNKSQTFTFEYMGPGPCEPGEYQSPCEPQANGPSHSRTKRPRPLTRVLVPPAAAPSS